MRFYIYTSCVVAYLLVTSEAFSTSKSSLHSSIQSIAPLPRHHYTTKTTFRNARSLYLFGNKGKGSNDDDDFSEGSDTKGEEKKRRIPFFGRLSRPKAQDSPATENPTTDEIPAVTATSTVAEEKKSENPADIAKSLRAQAERARLEAEKMDAELTLMKIEKLERELVTAKAKGDSVDDLQRQLELLQAKLRGEAPSKPVALSKPKDEVTGQIDPIQSDDIVETIKPKPSSSVPLDPTESYEDFLVNWEKTPGFLRKAEAVAVEIDFDTIDDIDPKEVWTRMEMIKNNDYSFSTKVKPSFTQAQIDAAIEQLDNKRSELREDLSDETFENYVEMAAGNNTKLAEYILEYEWYVENTVGGKDEIKESFVKIMKDEEWMQPVLEVMNQTTVDRTIESFYPKCTRKENGIEPTNAQVQSLATDVLPGAKFSATSKPEKVLGGYIIKGENRNENGDDLIAAIDRGLERSNLAEKMTVLYVPDFTFVAELDEAGEMGMVSVDFEQYPAILYVTGPDIVRERQRFLLSVTSALGLASSWYLSLYPFLLNPALAKRVEEQVALADASMAYDLNWLTNLSVPLFVAYIGILAVHELAHTTMAGFYEMETSVPTLVPSIITGTTSTVTTFKAPPKNSAAMFDFSIAGPLAGIVASCVALFLGSELTAASDPALLPQLPVDILRQSSLGGGIIDGILNGVLYVAEGAPTDGIMISLHPLAIAGYIGLIGNALALLPVGTTDGGRIGLTLFGRPGKLVIGNLFLFGLLFAGLFGSDLFLFYFSFVIAFQTGNEVPARNEADSLSFPRVVAATLAYCVAILALVPFQ